MSLPTPPLAVEIRPSRLLAASRLLLAACVAVAALQANLDTPLKLLLPALAGLALWLAWRDDRRRGLQGLRLEDGNGQPELTLRYTDGRLQRASCAGHAWLGTVAIFVFIEREGWRRRLGPQRLCIVRDAVSDDDFRRLRARLAAG